MMKGGVVGIVLTVALLSSVVARAADTPPSDPEARRTWIAERRAEAIKKREDFLKLSPEEQEKIRAEQHAQRDARREAREASRRVVEVQGPLPLPVVQGGEPAGASCPAGETCTLRLTPPSGRALVVTAVWSATKLECDGTSAAAPPSGAVVNPWWRCATSFTATGPGTGYLGFLTAK